MIRVVSASRADFGLLLLVAVALLAAVIKTKVPPAYADTPRIAEVQGQ